MTTKVRTARFGGTAVVCGAGVAGLLAARVLSDHVDDVVIVERERLSEEPRPPRDVPQSPPSSGVVRIVDDLFPGFVGAMVARGAPYPCAAFECELRRRVLELSNVEVRSEQRVVGLIASGSTSVHGIRTRPAGERDGVPDAIRADLVVDAMGRASAMWRWLEALGHPAPEEIVVAARWDFTSNRFRRIDRITRRPSNLLFVGDTVCALNPVHELAMTAAVLGATVLQHCLAEVGTDHLAERFHSGLAEALRFCWAVSTGTDLTAPGLQGPAQESADADLSRRWRRALVLATEDPAVELLCAETLSLMRSPDWLYQGDIATQVGWDRCPTQLCRHRAHEPASRLRTVTVRMEGGPG